MRVPHGTLVATLSLWLSLLCCSGPPGQVCGTGNECPVNSYCLVDQCVAPSTVAKNISVVVTPSDPTLAPQQFLPDQYQTVNGYSTILLTPPQTINLQIALPPNCGDAGTGYPMHFEFTGPTLIPGVPNDFQFDTDEDGSLSAVLPVGSYAESVSPAVACAAPLFTNDVVLPAGKYTELPLYAPILPGEDAVAPSLDVSGEVDLPRMDGGYVDGGFVATVRVLAQDANGASTGVRLSGDQPLQFLNGIGHFGSAFVPGGPAALPVLPVTATTLAGAPGIIQATDSKTCLHGAPNSQTATCDQFILEIGPSSGKPFLTTFDTPVDAPELDGGENPLVILQTVLYLVRLPLDPTLTFNLPIASVTPDGGQLPSAAVTISSVDGGITGCDGGFTCRLTATGVTDPANGTFTFPVVPGRYALTLDPPAPLGSSVTVVDVAADAGELSLVSGPGRLVGKGVRLPATPSVTVQGTIREPGPVSGTEGPLLPKGEVAFLTLSGLTPVATAPVSNGTFVIEVAPGTYVLLIEPDSSTRFPVKYVASFPVDENLPSQSFTLEEPSLLTGIVEVEAETDGGVGLPVPTQAYLEFYYVTSDGDGGTAYPVGSAVTDSQGRWSAPGPPLPGQTQGQ